MTLSLAGLIGAMLGCVIGVIQYLWFIGFIVRTLRAGEKSKPPAEREEFERKLSVMRRAILAVDVAGFAAAGYFVGKFLAG
jgi:hypothetical protein